MEECTLPPGWRCTREAGHPGPCAAEPVAAGLRRGIAWGLGISVAMWAAIIAACLFLLGCAGPADDRLVRCQRASPPWATGECQR